jgi:single-stranded DNA-binding protein
VNNVSLIGSLVSEPELTVSADGRDMCVMQIAVPRRGAGGAPLPGVIYVDLIAFGDQARTCANELAVGLRIGVSGTLEREDSLGAWGPRRARWEVYAHQVEFLDSAVPPSG